MQSMITTELIIALVPSKQLVDIVKASITGTIISNLLLVMGLFHAFGRSEARKTKDSFH